MAAPTAYDVTITINDVDVTDNIPFNTMNVDDYIFQVSTFRFTVENPSGVTPSRGHEIVMTADSLTDTPVVFLGYIIEVKTTKDDNGIAVHYECEAGDRKLLLQKSVMDVAELTGADTDIISGFLTNGYPDLSSYFDFSTGVSGFASGLTLPVGNSSILDALKDLAELTGGFPSFENVTAPASGTITIDFDGGDSYTIGDSGGSMTASVAAVGNPGNAVQSTSTPAHQDYYYVEHDFGEDVTITSLDFDFWYNNPDATNTGIDFQIILDGTLVKQGFTSGAWNKSTWYTMSNVASPGNFLDPSTWSDDTGQVLRIWCRRTNGAASGAIDYRMDNIDVGYDIPSGGSNQSQLNWDNEPPDADFDFNIDTSDEFGFDFDFTVGDFDDFNSVTVVGGYAQDSIEWTYPNQDGQTHINLETAVDDIVVEENTGTEGSPTWTALDVGTFGTDTLGEGSPVIDVLYDKIDHWLYFNTAPSDFSNAIRVSGTIRRPIRVRVENVADGDLTFATTIQNENISTVEQAIAVGTSKLNDRNAVKNLTFKTSHPGLKVGQEINVTDSDRGLNESLVIQRISTRWLAPSLAEFTVECGTDEAVGVDTIIANNDKRSKNNQLAAGADITTVEPYTDNSGNIMTDNNGAILYEVTS